MATSPRSWDYLGTYVTGAYTPFTCIFSVCVKDSRKRKPWKEYSVHLCERWYHLSQAKQKLDSCERPKLRPKLRPLAQLLSGKYTNG